MVDSVVIPIVRLRPGEGVVVSGARHACSRRPVSPVRGRLLDSRVIVSISGSTGDFPFRLPWMASDPFTVIAAIAGSVFLRSRPPFASTSSHFGRDSVRLVRGRFVAVLEESAEIVEADRECTLLARSSADFPVA